MLFISVYVLYYYEILLESKYMPSFTCVVIQHTANLQCQTKERTKIPKDHTVHFIH